MANASVCGFFLGSGLLASTSKDLCEDHSPWIGNAAVDVTDYIFDGSEIHESDHNTAERYRGTPEQVVGPANFGHSLLPNVEAGRGKTRSK